MYVICFKTQYSSGLSLVNAIVINLLVSEEWEFQEWRHFRGFNLNCQTNKQRHYINIYLHSYINFLVMLTI